MVLWAGKWCCHFRDKVPQYPDGEECVPDDQTNCVSVTVLSQGDSEVQKQKYNR